MNRAKEMRNSGSIGGEVILENSPVGESQSNGFVENAIREVQNRVRKLKDQLERNSASN